MTRYFTGKPCRRGHVAERVVSCANCIECKSINAADIKSRDRERFLLAQKNKQRRFRERRSEEERKADRERARKWYWKNREEVLAKRKANPERARAREELYKRTPEGRATKLLMDLKHNRKKAKELGLSISRDWLIKKLRNGRCELSGLPFDLSAKSEATTRNPYAPSIDRIDPAKGYTEENCRVVLWAMNAALGTWGEIETLKIMEAFVAACNGRRVA